MNIKIAKAKITLKQKILLLSAFLLIMCLYFPKQSMAAQKNYWVQKNGYHYYYNKNGKKTKGLATIDEEKYYFDKKGIMQTGWQKINKSYYFFDRNDGIMACKGTIDGIKIRKNGTAKKTKYIEKKIKTMITAHNIVEQITKPTDSKSQKRKKCFKWVFKFPYKRYRLLPPVQNSKDWEITFANDIFLKKQGDCVSESAAVAFLFHECGYENVYLCHDSEHSWVEINNKVFDPLFANLRKYSNYYNISYKKYFINCKRHADKEKVKLRKDQFTHVGRKKIY